MQQVTPSSDDSRHAVEIPEEAIERAAMPLSLYMARVDTIDAASDALSVAAPFIVAAELERMADRLDKTSTSLLGRAINADQDHGVRAAAEFLRRVAAELRGEE